MVKLSTPLIILFILGAAVLVGAGYFFWSGDGGKLPEFIESSIRLGTDSGESFSPAISSGVEVYQGTLPCADCEGIQTTLTLDPAPDGQLGSSYQMSSTYLGKSTAPIIVEGYWLLRGSQVFPNSTFSPPRNFLVLDMGTPSQVIYLVEDDTLTQLDSDGNEIDAGPGINFTLTRVGASTGTTEAPSVDDPSSIGESVESFRVPDELVQPGPTPPPPDLQ